MRASSIPHVDFKSRIYKFFKGFYISLLLVQEIQFGKGYPLGNECIRACSLQTSRQDLGGFKEAMYDKA